MSYPPKREHRASQRIVDRDRRNILSLESIAADLRRIADKYVGTTGEAPAVLNPAPHQPNVARCVCETCVRARADSFISEGPAAHDLSYRERFELYIAPVGGPYPPHGFEGVDGNRFCGLCGGGRLHTIHAPHASTLEYSDPVYSDPVGTWEPHEFVQKDGLTFCAKCVGGRLHAIHAAPTSLSSLPSVISDWNKAFPRGTAVTVEMPDGSKLSTAIVSESFVLDGVPAVFVKDLGYWVRLSQIMPEPKHNA